MMSHVHLTTTERAKKRVIAMGVEAWRVHRVGAPSLDHLRRSRLWTREELEAHLGFALLPPPIIVGFHPVTLDEDPVAEADALYEALETVTEPIVFSFPNADFGSAALIERARAFCDGHPGAHVVVNLPPAGFWGLLQHASLFLGNSSSGIMETPSLGLPCVNVGRRQQGRETAGNTVTVAADAEAIRRAMAEVGTAAFRARAAGVENPYGDGRAGERVVPILEGLIERERLLGKRGAARR